MKKFLFAILLVVPMLVSCGNDESKQDTESDNKEEIQRKKSITEPIFKMFPTQNLWNFLKLDTSNGRIWQVQYSINDDDKRFETILNNQPLIKSKKEQIPGRFTLISTQNIYNFILIDQVTGDTYQVQWSFDEDNRFVIPISN